ncbi:probable Bax inhibitor 1 [Dreissena polymorpha]|uniref:probable Bax inhibitor 1 n=1 Tax=Dreissena polymorpha TaxID=45954 RepID=UPI0022646029|nr:probable Bax inhibitor 1 [Dreissena polymorpha]
MCEDYNRGRQYLCDLASREGIPLFDDIQEAANCFLLSSLSWLCLAGFMNIFFRSQMIWNVQLYGGLLLFCAFVLYDTQLIIEKVRHGDDDYIWQSVDLFLDFINIFRRLMIILASKEEGRKRGRD